MKTLRYIAVGVIKATRAAVRDAQRERDDARVRRDMLLNAAAEAERASDNQASLLDQARAWRALIDNADWQFRRDVLLALDVRVLYAADMVTISTALSLPTTMGYMTARRYRRARGGEP